MSSSGILRHFRHDADVATSLFIITLPEALKIKRGFASITKSTREPIF